VGLIPVWGHHKDEADVFCGVPIGAGLDLRVVIRRVSTGDEADEDELDALANGRRMDVMIGIHRMSLAVRMYSPTKGSKHEQAPPNVDEGAGAGCSDAGPGGSILRSPSSLALSVNEPKVN
jgi:hypothetical protein